MLRPVRLGPGLAVVVAFVPLLGALEGLVASAHACAPCLLEAP